MKVQLPRSQSNCITTSAFEMLTPMITSSLYTWLPHLLRVRVRVRVLGLGSGFGFGFGLGL